MKILWFTWKDLKNPLAGGAELVNEEIAQRLVRDGHEVIFLVGGYPNCLHKEEINGYQVIRLGNRWSVYWKAYLYYKKYLENWADLIIEEINTFPFMTQWYTKKKKRILIFYQLCKEIWFYQMFFPLNLIGYLLEPIYLWLMKKNKVITISESSKKDLEKYGFKDIKIMPMATKIEPAKELKNKSLGSAMLLSLGSIRPMKRTFDIVKAFELSKKSLPQLQLIIAGDNNSSYGQKIIKYIDKSPYKKDIKYLGKISQTQKIKIMSQADLIAVTSVKEGWGLIVTEAGSQGTPAVVYNVDGLRDAVLYDKIGWITQKNTPENLSKKIITIFNDQPDYNKKRRLAWEETKKYSFESTYKKALKFLE